MREQIGARVGSPVRVGREREARRGASANHGATRSQRPVARLVASEHPDSLLSLQGCAQISTQSNSPSAIHVYRNPLAPSPAPKSSRPYVSCRGDTSGISERKRVFTRPPTVFSGRSRTGVMPVPHAGLEVAAYYVAPQNELEGARGQIIGVRRKSRGGPHFPGADRAELRLGLRQRAN